MNVVVRDHGPEDSSPLMLDVAGKPVALGRDVARRIWVHPVAETPIAARELAVSAR
jgi:Fe2+ transport system protein FeoA